ncbi:hypothetical protein [Ketobacter alkanivorans]|uniref:Uncharacterized protein n=1 Tax=Ketobacter alkanivorans TaxID=1917421 RepID=A0A2K9LV43_9GAMM|nr:hypothetical protein [Ketobacter alkanivorans]AUM14734.1 hypothetical protein Kalk_20895 [Ketobacter alkanivorans]
MKKSDIKIFVVVLLVVGLVVFNFVIKPRLMKDSKTATLMTLSTSLVSDIPYLSPIAAKDYKDSLRFDFSIGESHLDNTGMDAVRTNLDLALIKPVCEFIAKTGASPKFSINMVVKSKAGTVYDKYFSAKNCT